MSGTSTDNSFISPPPEKKSRRGDLFTLYPNSVDEQHEAKSQKKEYYLSTRARSSHEDTAVPFYKRALSAVKKSWSWQVDVVSRWTNSESHRTTFV